MSSSDYGSGAQSGQDRTPQFPAVIPGGLYTRKQLIHNLCISPNKIIAWEKSGLEYVPTGDGDKGKLYLGDDVLVFVKKLKGR